MFSSCSSSVTYKFAGGREEGLATGVSFGVGSGVGSGEGEDSDKTFITRSVRPWYRSRRVIFRAVSTNPIVASSYSCGAHLISGSDPTPEACRGIIPAIVGTSSASSILSTLACVSSHSGDEEEETEETEELDADGEEEEAVQEEGPEEVEATETGEAEEEEEEEEEEEDCDSRNNAKETGLSLDTESACANVVDRLSGASYTFRGNDDTRRKGGSTPLSANTRSHKAAQE